MKTYFTQFALALTLSLHAQPTIYLRLALAELTPTEKVYNFIVAEYNYIVASEYTIFFDGTKMSFKEIRNSLLQNLSSHSFNEPNTGELRHVWIDPDLIADAITKPTTIYQLVFDIHEGEGSDLCLSNQANKYLFAFMEVPGQESLAEIVIEDDCHEGLILDMTTTGAVDPETVLPLAVHALHLSPDGLLSFTSTLDQPVSFSLFDLQGREHRRLAEMNIAKGRQQAPFHISILQTPYIVQVSVPGQPPQQFLLIPH